MATEKSPFAHLKECGVVSSEAALAEWASLNPGSAGQLTLWLCERLYAPERAAIIAMPAADSAMSDTREAFERWVTERDGRGKIQKFDDTGEYLYRNTNAWWQCWRAARDAVPDWERRALRAEASLRFLGYKGFDSSEPPTGDELPALPAPREEVLIAGDHDAGLRHPMEELFDADQMRAYGEQCRRLASDGASQ